MATAGPNLAECQGAGRRGPRGDGTRVYFYYRSGLIYRSWRPQGAAPDDARRHEQLVLPVQCRSLALQMAHDVPMAGHLGVTKTKDRVLQRYYWPGVFKDIADYCRSCEVCQRSQPRHAKKASSSGLSNKCSRKATSRNISVHQEKYTIII